MYHHMKSWNFSHQILLPCTCLYIEQYLYFIYYCTSLWETWNNEPSVWRFKYNTIHVCNFFFSFWSTFYAWKCNVCSFHLYSLFYFFSTSFSATVHVPYVLTKFSFYLILKEMVREKKSRNQPENKSIWL